MNAFSYSMVIPQPSETVESLLLRVGRANGLTSAGVFTWQATWPNQLAGMPHRSAKAAMVLSQLLSIGFDEVISRHTLLPLVFIQHFGEEPCGKGFDFARKGSLCIQAKQLRFCPLCRTEDIESLGFSYFRRDHQIVGVNMCSDHAERLLRLKNGAEHFLPSDPDIENFVDGKCADHDLSPLSYQFRQLVVGLLGCSRPVDCRAIGQTLRAVGMGRGGNFNALSQESKISMIEIIKRRSEPDRSFINELLRESGTAAARNPLMKLKSVLHGAVFSPLVYALVALLITDCETLSRKILLGHDVRQVPRRVKETLPEQQLTEAYLNANGSYRGVEAVVKLCSSNIRGRLRGLGLPNLATGKRDLRKAFASLHDGGNIDTAAHKSGIDVKVLQQVLVRMAMPKIDGLLSRRH